MDKVSGEITFISVGVDLHKTQMTVCAIEENESILFEEVFSTSKEGYQELIDRLHEVEEKKDSMIRLSVETTGNARFFKNRMIVEGFEVIVVNTSKFKVITTSTKKNDRNDAYTLAYYLMKNMLPEAHLCDQESEELRRLLKTRSILVSSVVKIKNQIHGMMLGYGILTKGAQLQSQKKRQRLLKDLEGQQYSKYSVASFKTMLQILDQIAGQIKVVEKQLREMVKDNEDVELLMTVPGIGIITATTVAAYTKDLERFEHNFDKFAAYVGIVPSVHNSNDTVRLGKITKRGPQTLRTALVQAALGMIRMPQKTKNWRLMFDYKKMKEVKGSGRSIIATTRKLARILFVMLHTREPFNEGLMTRKKVYPSKKEKIGA
ncbi:MAG: IS110 family transposase [Sphaerochaetaceae bacterium]|nr:IS110 family transposase [Sphaerochaetaceae bacterium]